MGLNLAILLQESAARGTDRIAIRTASHALTYGELNAAANRLANGLRCLGVQRGERVAIVLPNTPDFVAAYYGVLKLGAAAVPVDPCLPAKQIRACLTSAQTCAVFTSAETTGACIEAERSVPGCRHVIIVHTPGLTPLPHGMVSYQAMLAVGGSSFQTEWTSPDDTAVIVCVPTDNGVKTVELTHANLFVSAVLLADRTLCLDVHTVAFTTTSLSHVAIQTCALNAVLYAGGTLHMRDPEVGEAMLPTLTKHGITYLVGETAMYEHLLREWRATQGGAVGPRTCLYVHTPATMPCAAQSLAEAFPGSPMIAWGLPETGGVATLGPMASRYTAVGLPLWGTHIRIEGEDGAQLPPDETGEVVIGGHHVAKGYLNDSDQTAQTIRNGWLHSGIRGRRDADGYLYLVEQ